jgi:hypothetical protein
MNVSIPFDSPKAVTDWAINWIRMQGLSVTQAPLSHAETPKELCARLDFCIGSLSRSMSRADCPPVETRRGPTGRLTYIKSNPEFDAWLKGRRNLGLRKPSPR